MYYINLVEEVWRGSLLSILCTDCDSSSDSVPPKTTEIKERFVDLW